MTQSEWKVELFTSGYQLGNLGVNYYITVTCVQLRHLVINNKSPWCELRHVGVSRPDES